MIPRFTGEDDAAFRLLLSSSNHSRLFCVLSQFILRKFCELPGTTPFFLFFLIQTNILPLETASRPLNSVFLSFLSSL